MAIPSTDRACSGSRGEGAGVGQTFALRANFESHWMTLSSAVSVAFRVDQKSEGLVPVSRVLMSDMRSEGLTPNLPATSWPAGHLDVVRYPASIKDHSAVFAARRPEQKYDRFGD